MYDFLFRHFCSGVSIAVPCHAWGIVLGMRSYSSRYAHSCAVLIGSIYLLVSFLWLDCYCDGIFRWFLGCLYCSMAVSWLMLRLVLGSGMNCSSCASSVSCNFLGGCFWDWFPLLLSASLSTPVISMCPIGQPLRYVRMNWVVWLQDSSLTRSMTMSGIGMLYQLLLVNFFPS